MNQSLPLGLFLDQYRIDSVLGSGGFGITYRAWDSVLQTPVAIKEYFPHDFALRGDDSTTVVPTPEHRDDYYVIRNKFLEEARTLARFKHPNIARVSRYLESNDTAYMVMDFEEGSGLDEVLSRRGSGMAQTDCIGLFLPVLNGVKRLHEESFLHRDIKPSNIYVRKSGEPLLLDFGSARQLVKGIKSDLTIMVSKGYAPPEQYNRDSELVGPWSDIYSLGATIYSCIVGQPPIDATARTSSLSQHQPDPLTPLAKSHGHGEYSQAFLDVVDSMLRLQTSKRPSNADEVIEQLKRFQPVADASTRIALLDERTVVSQETALGSDANSRLPNDAAYTVRRHLPAIAGATLVAVASIVAALLYFRPEPEVQISSTLPEPARATMTGTEPKDTAPAGQSDEVEEQQTYLAGETVSYPLKDGSHSPVLVVIPRGTYQMGSSDDRAEPDERPSHAVEIAHSFAMGAYEVTEQDFSSFLASVGNASKQTSSGNSKLPVTFVSWNEAKAYVNWLTTQTGQRFRLPTEAEWEYVARAGSSIEPDPGSTLSSADSSSGDPLSGPIEVGRHQPNQFSIYDMQGNVWEWTEDCWNADYSKAHGNGAALTTGDCSRHVIRGGAWNSPQTLQRATNRSAGLSETQSRYIGFRVAVDLQP